MADESITDNGATDLPEITGGESVSVSGPVTVRATYSAHENKGPAKEIVRRLGELLARGIPVEQAVQQIGLPNTRLNENKQVVQAVRQLVLAGKLAPEIRKEMVRAGLNISFLEAQAAGDRKGLVETAKLIAADPEVAIAGAAERTSVDVGVRVDLEALGSLLADLPVPEERKGAKDE